MLLILLVLFFTVGTQFIFSSQKVSGWVKTAVSKVKIEGVEEEGLKVTFDKAQVTVLGSLSYPIGVRIKNLKIEVTKGCETLKGQIGTVVVPFHFRKALKEKLSLGLVRLSNSRFETSNTCAVGNLLQEKKLNEVVQEGFANSDKKMVSSGKAPIEKRVIQFLEKISRINMSFVKTESGDLRSEGLLIYDLHFKIDEEKELLVERFKVLLGKGDLVARGEWNSELILPEGVSSLFGEFKISKDLVEAKLSAKEKEGRLELSLHVPRRESLEEKEGVANLNFKARDFPLSIASRFKKFKLAGLNLRKTWIDLDFETKVSLHRIEAVVSKFKAHGDFGGLNLGVEGLKASWADISLGKGTWRQFAPSEFKLSDVSLEEIISLNPKKRVRGVFGEFGKFSAFLKFENLNSLSGEFETKDFSIRFRSMGKAVYQKARHARGRLGYVIDEKLFFILDEVDLVEGAFEGFIKLEYKFTEKLLHTKFDVSHFRLNPKIPEDLFNIKIKEGIQIFGEGQALKTAFTEGLSTKEHVSPGNLQFMLKAEGVDFKHWSLSGVAANCGLDESELKCSLSSEELKLSEGFAQKAKIKKRSYENLRTKNFSYENQKLLFDLGNHDSQFFFEWTKKEGLGFYPNGYEGLSVKTRKLD